MVQSSLQNSSGKYLGHLSVKVSKFPSKLEYYSLLSSRQGGKQQVNGSIPFSAVTYAVSFLSVITLLSVSVIYHLKAYVVNFQNSHII